MSVRTDVINLQININGDDARSRLNNLKKTAADIKTEMSGLKKRTEEYISKSKELASVNEQMAALKKQIGITALTQKELVAELNKLKALKGSVEPFTTEFKDLEKQIKAVENRLYDVKNGVTGFQSFMSKIKDEVKQFGVLVMAYLGFDFLTSQFKNLLVGAGKVSDSLADIARVTGMTSSEVGNLNKSLSNLNTRTSTAGLREIAIIAGKLGVAKEDILGFVEATDKLVVALGDELGSADQITTELGKIIGVFDKGDKKVTGEKLTLIGNAIVDLANKGVASGGFIVDFSKRLGGLAETANLSLSAVMGLAAGLEESGQSSESSSTAIIKVLGKIGEDVPKYAKIAGKSVDEFSATLKEKPIEALLQVSEGLTKGKDGFEAISKAFSDAGEDGARIISTLGVIGSKADFFRGKIDDAGKAMLSTNEINQAFALKNETLGATLDKLGKEFNKLMTSNAVTGFLKSAVDGTYKFLLSIKELPKWLEENRTAISLLTLGIVTLNAKYILSAATIAKDTAVKIYNSFVTKGGAIADNLATAARAAYIVVTNALTGSISIATAAQRLWNITASLGAGPIGVLLLLIGSAILAYKEYFGTIQLTTNEQHKLNIAKEKAARIEKDWTDVQKEATEQTAKNIIKLREYEEIANDVNKSDEQRKLAIKGIIAINPEYFKGLDLEAVKTGALAEKVNNYVEALRNVALEKAIAKRKEDLMTEKLTLEEQRDSYNSSKYSYRNKTTGKLESIDLSRKDANGNTIKGAVDIFDKKKKEIEVKIAGIDSSLNYLDGKTQEVTEKLKKLPKIDMSSEELKKSSSSTSLSEKDTLRDKWNKLMYELNGESIDELERNFLKINEKLIKEVELADELLGKGLISKEEYDAAVQKMSTSAIFAARDAIEKAMQEVKKRGIAVPINLETKSTDALPDKTASGGMSNFDATGVSTPKTKQDEEDLIAKIEKLKIKYQGYIDLATTAHNILSNLENKRLNKELAGIDKQKQAFKKQLDNKLINQRQYQAQIEKLDEQAEQKKKKAAYEQAKREKALNIAQTILNGIVAISKAAASAPFPANIPAIIVETIRNGALVAQAASTPLPELGDGDWVRKGDKHRDRSRGIPVMIEREEAVMKADAMTDNNQYTVTGTPAQITSALNSINGGTSWAKGALIEMANWSKKVPVINSNMPKIMEQGGIVRNLNNTNPPTTIDMSGLIEEVKSLKTAVEKWPTTIQGKWVYRDFKEAETLFEAAKKASGIN